MRAERNIFVQIVILSIEHNVDIELTLTLPLGPVHLPLSSADCMPTKTDIYSLQVQTSVFLGITH